MGQDLLELPTSYFRTLKTRYFLATTSTGLRAIRGSASKVYEYACVSNTRNYWGHTTSAWSSRKELAEKNARSYTRYFNAELPNYFVKEKVVFEVVKTQEISAKEARKIKKEINKEIMDARIKNQETENN